MLFKDDGRCYAFYGMDSINQKNLQLDKGHLNYLVKKNNKNYYMQYTTINCGAYSKCEIEVNKDTLRIAMGNNKGYRIWNYYLKSQLQDFQK